MALITCQECGKQYTDTIKSCLHCGFISKSTPKKYDKSSSKLFDNQKGCFVGLVLIAAILLVVIITENVNSCSRRNSSESSYYNNGDEDIEQSSGDIMLSESEEYIQFNSSANIRFSPSTNSSIITQGSEGNVFEMKDMQGDWYTITMFSGEYRYVYKSLCKTVEFKIQLPSSESLRKTVFMALLAAEDKAFEQSIAKYPTDFNRQIDYQRVLEDKYKLEAINKFNVQPPNYTKLIVEGVKNGWSK